MTKFARLRCVMNLAINEQDFAYLGDLIDNR